MLLHHAGNHGNRSNGHAHPHGVVAQAHPTAKQLTQVGDGADAGVLETGGVGAGALEQYQLGAAGGIAGGAHGRVKLAEAGHYSGDDQGFSGGDGFFDQRQVVSFEAGDREGGGGEVFQADDGVFFNR